MILNFEREIDEIKTLLDDERQQHHANMRLAMLLAGVLDTGMSMERERCIHIVQKLSLNAMDVVREIRKPLR